jgi:hypothetical protein
MQRDRAVESALVKVFVQVCRLSGAVSLDHLVALLGERGIDAETAERLIAFVPIACAHVLLPHRGVQLQPDYLLYDPDTERQMRARLADEPIFVAALELATQSIHSEWVCAMAADSAEWNAVAQMADPVGCVLTEPLLTRIRPSRVL